MRKLAWSRKISWLHGCPMIPLRPLIFSTTVKYRVNVAGLAVSCAHYAACHCIYTCRFSSLTVNQHQDCRIPMIMATLITVSIVVVVVIIIIIIIIVIPSYHTIKPSYHYTIIPSYHHDHPRHGHRQNYTSPAFASMQNSCFRHVPFVAFVTFAAGGVQ